LEVEIPSFPDQYIFLLAPFMSRWETQSEISLTGDNKFATVEQASSYKASLDAATERAVQLEAQESILRKWSDGVKA